SPAAPLALPDGTPFSVPSAVAVTPVPGPTYVLAGLGFYVELRSPGEVRAACKGRAAFLAGRVEGVQGEIDGVAEDVRGVLAHLKELEGVGVVLEEKGGG
ncbi:hypothetical protein TeGR_g6794, partial [Tetraparma gracilis]